MVGSLWLFSRACAFHIRWFGEIFLVFPLGYEAIDGVRLLFGAISAVERCCEAFAVLW